jgi:hypothetical protein
MECSGSSSCKRLRTESGTSAKAWSARFAQSVMLKSFCENISNILSECYFEVVKGDEGEDSFSGLSVETISAGRITLVQARLSAQVTCAQDTIESKGFCVRMVNLNSCLRSVHACHFVDIWQIRGSSDLVLRVYEPSVSNYVQEYHIKTLAKEDEYCRIEELDYSLFVEIDLETFRSAVKTAKEHKAELFSMSVLVPKVQKSQTETTQFFVLAYEGEEVSSKFPYQSSTLTETLGEGKPVVLRASDAAQSDYQGIPESCDLDILFSDRFSTDNLFQFTRSMERHVLTLRLGRDRPLLLEFPMGGGRTDYIRFILAPHLD